MASVFFRKCGHNRVLGALQHCDLCIASARERAIAKAGLEQTKRLVTLDGRTLKEFVGTDRPSHGIMCCMTDCAVKAVPATHIVLIGERSPITWKPVCETHKSAWTKTWETQPLKSLEQLLDLNDELSRRAVLGGTQNVPKKRYTPEQVKTVLDIAMAPLGEPRTREERERDEFPPGCVCQRYRSTVMGDVIVARGKDPRCPVHAALDHDPATHDPYGKPWPRNKFSITKEQLEAAQTEALKKPFLDVLKLTYEHTAPKVTPRPIHGISGVIGHGKPLASKADDPMDSTVEVRADRLGRGAKYLDVTHTFRRVNRPGPVDIKKARAPMGLVNWGVAFDSLEARQVAFEIERLEKRGCCHFRLVACEDGWNQFTLQYAQPVDFEPPRERAMTLPSFQGEVNPVAEQEHYPFMRRARQMLSTNGAYAEADVLALGFQLASLEKRGATNIQLVGVFSYGMQLRWTEEPRV